jgi:hypothetical protein
MRLAVVFFQLLIKVKIINLDIAPFVKLVFVDKIKNKKLNIIGLPTYFNENKKLNFVLGLSLYSQDFFPIIQKHIIMTILGILKIA